MKPSDLAAKVGSDEGLPPRQREDPQRATPFKARHWIDGCGVCCALAYSVLALQPTRIPLTLYFAALALAWVASLVAFAMLRGADGAFPLRRMLIWCLLFRAIGLTSEPVLEDDHYRYLWDGRTFAVEGSPYLGAPIDHFDNRDIPERFDHILDRINHPDLPTVYPLVAQATFLVGYWIAPGELAPIKLLLLLADLATLALLLRMIAPRKALLYAWCPLLIQETAFSGHIDSLGVLFLVAGLHGRTGEGAVLLVRRCRRGSALVGGRRAANQPGHHQSRRKRDQVHRQRQRHIEGASPRSGGGYRTARHWGRRHGDWRRARQAWRNLREVWSSRQLNDESLWWDGTRARDIE